MVVESKIPAHHTVLSDFKLASSANLPTSRTNSFFDKMNKEFFRPRGLYCLIMTWNPELSDAPSTAIDVNSLVSKASSNGNADAFTRLFHRFKSSDGKTYGNIFQDVAPLVFPEIDELASDENAGKKLSKLKRKKEFVGGYLDRRAQAKFVSVERTLRNRYTMYSTNRPLDSR